MNPAAIGTTTPPLNSANRRHLQRWNTMSTSAFNHRGFCSVPSDDLELLPLKAGGPHTYSSLRDLLPPLGAVNSPRVKTAPPGSDIRIRNRLVKQAARAYLSPMSDYPSSAGGNFFHRLWTRVAAFIDFFCTKLVRALRAVRIQNVLPHTLNSS
ncbi:hypothetical protein SASPL_105506 [Salvia splendens]|uniref:Uncharacterized protein n=1 Tax=Salvia splendens TaxID=180675 RepID=A0A8X9A9D3_SALSN|nr:hypothetical protein SASPL_105506 [Salvia splendens]